jgi:putative flippase GtrA
MIGQRSAGLGWLGRTARIPSVLSDRFQGLRGSPLAARVTGSPMAARVTRYTIGSIVALATSMVVFSLLYIMGVGTTACTVSAFVAGAIPNWILNRRWAWRQRGRPEFAREVVAYVAVTIVALIASSLATAWANTRVQTIPAHHGIRVLLVTASYVAVQGILFVAKFAIYEFWIFSGRSHVRAFLRSRFEAERTRRQVLAAARANRTP